MKKECIEFLSELEGYHQMLKTIHWSTTNKAEHLLTDDIDGDILGYEDRFAEALMGEFGERFKTGELKSLLPNSHDTKSLLNELKGDLETFNNNICKGKHGLENIVDDFFESINKWKYLATLS